MGRDSEVSYNRSGILGRINSFLLSFRTIFNLIDSIVRQHIRTIYFVELALPLLIKLIICYLSGRTLNEHKAPWNHGMSSFAGRLDIVKWLRSE